MRISNYRSSIAALSAVVLVVALVGIGASTAAASSAVSNEQLDGDGTAQDPYQISTVEELQAVSDEPGAHYVLTDDVDASATASWNVGSGFEPIGSSQTPFTGTFDGQNHTISGLTIDRPNTEDAGLFGYAEGTIENVHLEDVDVRGGDDTGALVGETTGEIRRVSASGDVGGTRAVGGLVGQLGDDGEGSLEQSAAAVDVVGGEYVGGVAGDVEGSVQLSYATGTVVGDMDRTDAYGGYAGGLVGTLDAEGEVQLAYATGDVTHRKAGGLVGANHGPVRTAYATGDVTGDQSVGGIMAFNNDHYAGSDGRAVKTFWDTDTTGQSQSDDDDQFGTALSTDQLTGTEARENLEGFDFEYFWTATDEYPVLQWQVQDVSVALDESTVTGGDRTDVVVTLTLDDGSTVTASEVADYEADALVDVDAGVVDTAEPGTAEITATVDGYSDTASLEVTEPPNIELEDGSLDAPAVVTGTESAVTATATYSNDGGPGAHTAELIADGEVVATERLWLEADSETTVEFEWRPDGDASTEYDVAIDGTDLGPLTVVDPDVVSLESVSVPEQIGSGTSYDVTADIATEHDEPVLATVAYELEDEPISTDPVLIEPDGSTIAFEHGSDAAAGQELTHAVALEGETLAETSAVAEPPAFEITEIDAPDEVTVDEAFDLTVTVENTGELEGVRDVAVSADGADLDATELVLEPGSSDTVATSVTEDEAGDYEYSVVAGDDEETTAVSVAAEAGSNETDDSDTDDAESDGDSDGLPGFTAGITAVALLAIVTLARRCQTDTRR